MKPILSALTLLLAIGSGTGVDAQTQTCQVSQSDIYDGYIIKKIPLHSFAKPEIIISNVAVKPNVALPKDAQPSDPSKFSIRLGIDRKQPFAVVSIPAYAQGAAAGAYNQVTGFTLTVNEQPAVLHKSAAKTTDVTTSVLNSGTWYKIGVTKTGFYKLDYNFLNSMGLHPSSINPANIRIVGNGGHLLSENNAVPRPTDLLENSVLINDNGDNVFDNGESVVFYATGPLAWIKDSVNQRFTHQTNIYSDTAYYFISVDAGPAKRITTQGNAPAGNTTVSSYNYYDLHELELVNPAGLGKYWYGEQFNPALGNLTQTFTFNTGTPVANMNCAISFASTSASASSGFRASLNGNFVGSWSFDTPTKDSRVMNLGYVANTVGCNSATASVAVTFIAGDAGSNGYLDYIEINGRPSLSMTGDQMSFRDWNSVGAGNIASYVLASATSATRVWDVTDPQNPVIMNGTFDGSNYRFSQDAAMLHEFAAMNGNNLYTPKYVEQVPNQNLHGTGPVDLIIVTHPDFYDQAIKVRDYHKTNDNMNVVVVKTTEIYNEFSSGAQDISAIRDFAKMLYDRAGSDSTKMPKYMLLFGCASYDYKNRLANNCNFVPVFESSEATVNVDAFSGDDFFGFLDDQEYIEDNSLINSLDMGIGRLPARSVDDANAMVGKILNYRSAATLGPWRISGTVVADLGCHDSAGDHMADAETMASSVDTYGDSLYNLEKVYVDAIPIVTTPAGPRCPNANDALDEQVYNGTFLINYNGHGNPTVWSSERILTSEDFNKWNNKNMLPFMVTATCDFGQFDHPQYVSSAEQMVVRKDGGVIVILTTTEAVYADYNAELNTQYLQAQLTRNADGSWNTFGEASRTGKNMTYLKTHIPGKIANFRKFALLGDPALTPDFPENKIQLDSVFDDYTHLVTDSVKALGSYTFKGSVRDLSGNLMSGFSGLLNVTFYDKPRSITTISGCNSVYNMQDNIVYKGRVSVVNGVFSFSFIAPKDINYSFGAGKVSMYAENGKTDAAGSTVHVTVGGFSDHPVLNDVPPVVKAYINDSLFHNGGITGSNTSLFATFYDKTGINVTGTYIGHDLTAVLDGNVDAPYILNNYYQTAPNTYQYGTVSFALSGLADGKHNIKIKAWDVNDNVGEGEVDFVVIDGKVMDIDQLGNYPNPFSTQTNFVFEHNHPFENLDVQIDIYSIGGQMVRSLKSNLATTDSRTVNMSWDGTDGNGGLLPSGVYVYRLTLTTPEGYKSSAYQKLVIAR